MRGTSRCGLRPSPDEYARIVVEYCREAKQRTGSAPAIVGIQNEVEQAPEVFAEMVLVLRRELDKAGFKGVKIHMADAPFMDMATGRVKDLQRKRRRMVEGGLHGKP